MNIINTEYVITISPYYDEDRIIGSTLELLSATMREVLETEGITKYSNRTEGLNVLVHVRISFDGKYFRINLLDGIVLGSMTIELSKIEDVKNQGLKVISLELLNDYREECCKLSASALEPRFDYYNRSYFWRVHND